MKIKLPPKFYKLMTSIENPRFVKKGMIKKPDTEGCVYQKHRRETLLDREQRRIQILIRYSITNMGVSSLHENPGQNRDCDFV